ncbi:MAG: imidazole glycerol phosphate synthase subunit HisH [Planctomycetaceae bacterium]|nr:imidazole glycerol phosphate synthase subunit HisH [Planctomycetaceae bacterium]
MVAIVDCGSGNLRSVTRALEHAAAEGGIRAEVIVTHVPEQVRAANRIVLPGQGAFASCLAGLNRVDGLRPALEEAVRGQGKPFFGICVGMQLMADVGEEHGRYPGFGWIPGHVVPLRPSDPTLKIPHMGWNALEIVHDNPLLSGISNGDYVYFVHSYHVVPTDEAVVATRTMHGTQSFVSIIAQGNLFATQFHPEKSQRVGLKLLENFASLPVI